MSRLSTEHGMHVNCLTLHFGGEQLVCSLSILCSVCCKTVLPSGLGTAHLSATNRHALRRRLSEGEMARGVGMLQSGSSQRLVAGALGVSQSVASRLWNRYQTTVTVTQRHSGGLPRATSQREDRYLIVQARCNPFRNATQLQNDLHNASGNRISTQTVRRRFGKLVFIPELH